MSSMTNAFETALGLLIFNNTDVANVGDAAGLQNSATAGTTQLTLSTSALTDADTLLTATEVAYTGYARPTPARSGAGWSSSGDTISNAALIQFGEMTAGGPDTVVHLGLGLLGSGNQLDLHQDLAADLVINNGVNPQFAIGALDWVFA
jgi:hypothetical protein